MRNNKNKGFTLVELLVVIAILAILATVSVVGYTSYIKNAEISNDQNLAGQLNQFSAAINADHTSDFHNTAITPENVWAVTNEIRELGGLDEIVPSALKYGHLYFRFDKDEDGNYVGGEYVFVEDKDIKNSGLHFVLRAFGLVPNERPGFFEGNDGNLYFLIDTAGSNLAEAVRGFYTFDFLAEEDDTWAKFQEIVADAAAEGHTNISTALENTVFATAEGSKWIPGKESYDLVFHVDENVTLSEGTPTINIEVNNGVATPIVVPKNVIQLEVGSLVLNADVSTLTNAPVVFEAPAKELGDVINADFPYTFVDGNGATCKVEDAHIETSSGESIKVKISNYLKDFDIKVIGAENKVYNSVVEDVFTYAEDGTTKTGITTNNLNSAYIVWDGVTFSLALDTADYEFYFSDSTKPLSSKKINWELVSLNAPEGVTLTDADKACVVFDEETATFTLSKDAATGLYPNITSITVKGTVAHVADDVTATSHTFTINLPRVTEAAFKFGGNSVTNNAVDVLWGIKADNTYMNSYDLELVSTADNDGLSALTYDTVMTVTHTWAADKTVVDNFNYTFNDVFTEITDEDHTATDSDKAKTITMTVNVGGYQKFTFTINVNHSQFLFEKAATGFNFVGIEGAKITLADLFKQVNADATYEDVKLNVYYVPQSGQSHSINNLDTNYRLETSAEAAALDGVYGTAQSIGTDGTIDFALINNELPAEIILVVTVDGVRASENLKLSVINATNVREYADTGYTRTESVTTTYSNNSETAAKNSRKTVTTIYTLSNAGDDQLLSYMTMKKVETYVAATDDNGATYYYKDTPNSTTITNELKSNIVLFGDIAMSGDVNFLTIPAGKTFYGNTFDFDIKAGRRTEEGIIYLKGTIRDVRVLGSVYGSFAGTVFDDCGSSAICANGTNSYIYNCYIANTRSPLRTSGTTIVEDSTFFGGRYSNIDITGGTLTIRGKVTTVQQKYSADNQSNVIGIGISAWFNDGKKTVVVEDTATFKQYNFMSEDIASSLPALSYSGMPLVYMDQLFEALFTNTYSAYHFYTYETNEDGTYKLDNNNNNNKIVKDTYVHAGIAALDKYMLDYEVTQTKVESGICSGKYKMKVKVTTAVADDEQFIIHCPANTYDFALTEDQSDYTAKNVSQVTVTGAQLKAGVYFVTRSKSLNLTSNAMTYGFLITNENYETLVVSGLENYETAEYDYDMGTAFTAASSFLDQFHGRGIHYNHMLVPVHTADRDNDEHNTMLEEYLEIVANNYYTPEEYFFNSQGTLSNYSN